jgi:hypothetical protein
MVLSDYDLNIAILLLGKADGEDIQYILRRIGMDEQLLRQLIITAPYIQLRNCIEERESLILIHQSIKN